MEKVCTNENRRLALAAKAAGAGNRILGVLGGLLILLMLLYGGYYLWATWQIYDAAFLDDELLAYKPAVSEDGTNPTLSELAAINPDVCAWITIDDTNIDYPVVRCTDNLEYINKNVYGEFSLSGAIFFDSSTSADLSDAYLLLFGHHVTGGGMFGNVTDYLDEEYFRTHTTGNLFLPEETFAIEIFAAAEVDASDEVIYNPAAQHCGRQSRRLRCSRHLPHLGHLRRGCSARRFARRQFPARPRFRRRRIRRHIRRCIRRGIRQHIRRRIRRHIRRNIRRCI